MAPLDIVPTAPSVAWRILVKEGVMTTLLVILVLWGAFSFANDLDTVVTTVQATERKIDTLDRTLQTLIKINRQMCLNSARDSIERAGCMVGE